MEQDNQARKQVQQAEEQLHQAKKTIAESRGARNEGTKINGKSI